ncbi:MAG: histidine kinase [Prevotellaceae bacterium]|jgi:hypothetical protein|nr:histidine kinase [Prevotellaceae bacterium]
MGFHLTLKNNLVKKQNSIKDKLQAKYGLHVAMIIAFVMVIPRLIRFEATNLQQTFHFFCYTFCCIFLLWIICYFFITQKKIENKAFKCFCAIGTCLVLSSLFQWGWFAVLGNPNIEQIRLFKNSLSRWQLFYFFIFNAISFSGLVYFIAYSFNITLRSQKNQLEIELLKQENLEARLKLLKQQVSPHFLFNALSTLKTIVGDPQTKNYIVQLSNVYRYLLSNKDNSPQLKNLVSLCDELAFIQSYLYILAERFEEALQVEINVNENLMQKKLPPLALQILIENAIKHNIISSDEPLLIEVYNEGEDTLAVCNRLQPKISTDDSLGIGLQNIKDRYRLLGDKAIEVIPTGETFTVKIPLL